MKNKLFCLTNNILYSCLFLLVACTACSRKDRVRGTQTQLLVVNASPNSGALELYQNLRQVGGGSFRYLNTPEWNSPVVFLADSGFQQYQVRRGNELVANYLLINTGTANSIWMFDTVAAGRFRCILLEDKLDTPGRAKAKIRLIHLSPDADTVQLLLNAATVAADWSYFSQDLVNSTSLDEFLVVDTGWVQFRVHQKRTLQVVKDQRLYLKPNGVYSLVLKGYLNRGGADSLSLTRIIHN
jgi:hypothetical protein